MAQSMEWVRSHIYFGASPGQIEWNMSNCAGHITQEVVAFAAKNILDLKSSHQSAYLIASNIEFSKCRLDNDMFRRIMDCLRENNIMTLRLKFFGNGITDARPLVEYLNSSAGQRVREIHLSHNKLVDESCTMLLSVCADNGIRSQKPVYLRLEKNACTNPDGVVRSLGSKVACVHKVGEHCSPESGVHLHAAFFPGSEHSRTQWSQQWAQPQYLQYAQPNAVYGAQVGAQRPTRSHPVVLVPNARLENGSGSGAAPVTKRPHVDDMMICRNCDYLCTGAVEGFCCRMCQEKGTHGPQCRKCAAPPGAKSARLEVIEAKRKIPVPPPPPPARKRPPPPPPRRKLIEGHETISDSSSSCDFSTRAPPLAKCAPSKARTLDGEDEDAFVAGGEWEKQNPEWNFRWLKEAESIREEAIPDPVPITRYYLDLATMEISTKPPEADPERDTIRRKATFLRMTDMDLENDEFRLLRSRT